MVDTDRFEYFFHKGEIDQTGIHHPPIRSQVNPQFLYRLEQSPHINRTGSIHQERIILGRIGGYPSFPGRLQPEILILTAEQELKPGSGTSVIALLSEPAGFRQETG